MRVGDLAVLVLEHVGADAVQHALGAAGERGGVTQRVEPVAACFDAEELDAGVFGEGVEHAGGVTAAADTGDHGVGELAALLEHLGFGFVADDGLEGPDDGGEGVWSNGGADDVVCCVELDNPGAQSFVHSITESSSASLDSDDLRSEKLDSEDVESLSSDIFLYGCQCLWSLEECIYVLLPYRWCISCQTLRRP